MINSITKANVLLSFFMALNLNVFCQTNLTVDPKEELSDVSHNPTGYNLVWFMDDDTGFPNRNPSTEASIVNLNAGSLRFPYGNLGDNYLWTWPLNNNPNSLNPRTAIQSVKPNQTKWPNYMTDVTNGSDAYSVANNELDFDEFITICSSNGIEPIIMVNAVNSPNGYDINTLIQSAANWVHYANIVKGYDVKYWEIGNEVEGDYSYQAYMSIFFQFENAMKAIDPTIKVGMGNHTNWFEDAMNDYGSAIDFMTAHPYNIRESVNTYEKYRTTSDEPEAYLDRMVGARDAIRAVGSDTEIMVSEVSSFSWNNIYGNYDNNVFKSMILYEMLGELLVTPEVKYYQFWGLHSPWSQGRKDDTAIANDTNEVLPMGFISGLFANNIKDKMVSTTKSVGYLRTFSSVSNTDGSLTVWILNKNNIGESIELDFLNYNTSNITKQHVYTSSDVLNSTFNYSESASHLSLTNNKLLGLLPKHSITMLQLNGAIIESPFTNSTEYYISNEDNKLKGLSVLDPSHASNYEIITTTSVSADQSLNWSIIESNQSGYYYIENKEKNTHIQAFSSNGIRQVPNTSTGDWVKWEVSPIIGEVGKYYLKNKAFQTYLRKSNVQYGTGTNDFIVDANTSQSNDSKWEIINVLSQEVPLSWTYLDNQCENLTSIRLEQSHLLDETGSNKDFNLGLNTWQGDWSQWKFTLSGEAGYYFIEGKGNPLKIQSIGFPEIRDGIHGYSTRLVPLSYTGDLTKWAVIKNLDATFSLINKGTGYYLAGTSEVFNSNNNKLKVFSVTDQSNTLIKWRFSSVQQTQKSIRTLKQNDIEENSIINLSIYPNPIKQGFTLKTNYNNHLKEDKLNVAILNMLGQRVGSFDFVLAKDMNVLEIETDELKPGNIYLLQFVSGKSKETRKLLIKN